MIAYKFRGQSQIAFALEIMFENRLFCAERSTLNDPMEGIFSFGISAEDKTDYQPFLSELGNERKPLRICSLCMTFNCHLLWAHYAEGFRGLAIEIELPDNAPEISEVEYGGVFGYLKLEHEKDAKLAARKVLSSKNKEWSYEREVRILQPETNYELPNPVRRIIVGHRMNPSLFETLRIVCAHKKIEINRVGIGDEGIDADFVPALGERW
jgi:Protein of unknown function (DUF2971)